MSGILKEKLINKEAKIAVIGLGYVGLPSAIELARVGFNVYGIDISTKKVESLKQGKSYISDIDDNYISALINKKLFVYNDFSILSEADAIIICVPTPLNDSKEPDVSYIVNAANEIEKHIKKDTLVVLESTTYPGTTEELIINVIEQKRNFKIGEDFFACYSPERIDPGNKKYNVKNTPRVIGGFTETCLELGTILYSTFLEKVIPVSSLKTAETVKLFENTFRSVNIALVNELAQMLERMKLNVWEVLDASATKPFGFMPFYPGPGIGGHCIPLDPMYLSWEAKKSNFYNRFIETSKDINDNMPRYIISQINDILNNAKKPIKGSNIFIIGIAYKKDVNDLRESPALDVIRLLTEKGGNIMYYDPYIPSLRYADKVILSEKLNKENLRNSDLVVILTDHTNIDYQFIIDNSKIIYDTKNITSKYNGDNISLLGCIKK